MFLAIWRTKFASIKRKKREETTEKRIKKRSTTEIRWRIQMTLNEHRNLLQTYYITGNH